MNRIVSPRPSEGEVRVVVGAIGLSALGTQIAGTVDAVARESVGFARGDRVSFRAQGPVEGERILVAERDLVGVPGDVSLDAAAAVMPCAALARTVVRQIRPVLSGDRVAIADTSVIAPFVAAWVRHLGAEIVDVNAPADLTVTRDDIRAGRAWALKHGNTQQWAADVVAAIRAGAFDAITFSTPDEARAGSRSPVLLHPADVSLAA